ncbi:MAG: tetratricopeptide repeat protein [Thermodesulfobacteriota bacterium]
MVTNGKRAEPLHHKKTVVSPVLWVLAGLAFSLAPLLVPEAAASRASRQNTYEAVLAVDPSNMEAMEGRLRELKAEKAYLEAASVVKAALPGKRRGRERARLETTRARYLAWSKDYDGAICLYRAVLRDNPDMVDTRKGYAAVLGWKGLYEESIKEYKKVLNQRPGDTEATMGLARTLAWKGDYRESIALYREVLNKDSTNNMARLELGRVLWWSGERRAAEAEVQEILEAEPQNSGAKILDKKIRHQKGPRLSLDFSVSDDSDDNHLEKFSGAIYYSPLSGLGLTLGFSHFDASRLEKSASAESLWLRSVYKFSKKSTIKSRVAYLSLDSPGNPTSEMTWGLSLRRKLPRDFRAGLGYSHYVLLDTAQLIGNDIRVDDFYAHVSGNLKYVDAAAGVGYGSYSDGNTRQSFFLDISRGAEYHGVLFTPGYRLDYRDFSKDLNSGYFDPAGFLAHSVYGRLRGAIYDGRIEYDALAAAGLQAFGGKTESTTKLSLEIKGHVTEKLTLRGGAKYSRSALASASGFRYEEYKAGLDYQF